MTINREEFLKGLRNDEVKASYPLLFLDARFDELEQIFFAKELEYVKAKTYDVKYPPYMARNLIPVSPEANNGAETIKYEQYDRAGFAKIVSNYAKDFPRVDIKAKEFISPVRSLGASYGYNFQEVRAAAMAGKPLQQRRANAAKEVHVAKEHQIAMFGDEDYNLPGFLNNPNILTGTVPNDGSGPSTLWSTKTQDQILRDMFLAFDAPFNNTNGVESFTDTLLLPNEQYAYISATPRSTTSDTTILEFFRRVRPGATVMPVWDLADGNYPASFPYSGNLMIAYYRNPDRLTMEIPQDFEQLPPDKELGDWVIPTHQRVGGTIIYYPLSVAVYDSI